MRFAPVLPVIVPLFTAALLAALSKLTSQRTSYWVALTGALTVLASAAYLLHASLSGTIVYWFGRWVPAGGKTLGICFAIDPYGASLVILASCLTVAALFFSAKYFDGASNHFHALLMCFLGAMAGFSLTGDLFNLFVFFELMSASAFALCGHKTEDPGSLQGSLNFAVTNTIGAYFVLTGIALLYARTSALNMAQIAETLTRQQPDALVVVAFTFILCGYLVKAALVPFHFWLADAHAVAPTPVCILFSGVMVELGLYAVARIYWSVFAPSLHPYEAPLRTIFVSLGALTAVLGAIMSYSQRNVKRLLAFSTISHMGVLTMGFGFLTPVALGGVAIYVLGHGAAKASLFLCAGILLHRFESVDEHQLYGKGRSLRPTAVIYAIGILGLAGVPLSPIAAGHAMMHASAEQLGFRWAALPSIFAAAVTSAAVLRAGVRIFGGVGPFEADEEDDSSKNQEKPETQSGHGQTPRCMLIPALLLAIAGLSLNLIPQLKEGALRYAAQFQDTASYARQVLGHAIVHPASLAAPDSVGWEEGALVILLAVSIVVLHLASRRIRDTAKFFRQPLRLLHQLHSGNVGDYVAFMVFGIAVFGLVCLWSLRS